MFCMRVIQELLKEFFFFHRIIIVLNMEVIIPKCDIVGEPKQFIDANSSDQQ